MQTEQVRNWLVLPMIFAWDHLILSSLPYIPRSKTSLPFRFLSKIYYTYRTCYMRLQSPPVFYFGELKEKPIQHLPRNNFGYHVTCHFSARVSAVLVMKQIWTMFVWNSFCLRADYLQALQLTQIRIFITRSHVNIRCFFVCVHDEDSLQRGNKLWVTVQ